MKQLEHEQRRRRGGVRVSGSGERVGIQQVTSITDKLSQRRVRPYDGFQLLDADRNGSITYDEFARAVAKLNVPVLGCSWRLTGAAGGGEQGGGASSGGDVGREARREDRLPGVRLLPQP
eukprot:92808-Hanusia_phi.AAC.4